MWKLFAIVIALAVVCAAAAGFTRATAVIIPQGPVMGYNTWYQYRTAASQADVLTEANLLVSTGLARDGYDTVNLDDGWMAPRRTAHGALTWDSAKFPNGIPWLAAQLHAMGRKLGIYTAIGTKTCTGFPGSWAHYRQDTRAFVSWGIDFVKVDECGGLPAASTAATVTHDFAQFAAYIRRFNPSVIYSEELPIYTMGTPHFIPSVRGKPYPGGGVSVLLANTAASAATATFTLAQVGVASARASVHDVWSGTTGTFGGLSVTLGAGRTALYVITPP